jgi:hypothetical protein
MLSSRLEKTIYCIIQYLGSDSELDPELIEPDLDPVQKQLFLVLFFT